MFQSRYRAASHFRLMLIIEVSFYVKFPSRYRAASHFRTQTFTFDDSFLGQVSISLSSGFSFQANAFLSSASVTIRCFNLVIERLLISGHPRNLGEGYLRCFNLVIERLLISGFWLARMARLNVCFNLVIERLLISGLSQPGLPRRSHDSFNLVIERLLISG